MHKAGEYRWVAKGPSHTGNGISLTLSDNENSQMIDNVDTFLTDAIKPNICTETRTGRLLSNMNKNETNTQMINSALISAGFLIDITSPIVLQLPI